MNVAKILTGHELFRALLPDQVAAISRFSSARKLDKGEVIYRPDRRATHVFVLLDGQVELRLPSGSSDMGFLVSRVARGELFGIAPLLGSDRYTTSALCTKSSTVLFVESRPLKEMLHASPTAGLRIMSVAAGSYFDRYQTLIERIGKALSDLALEG